MGKKIDKKNIKLKKGLELINKIEKVRSKNNHNWMDLLKLSLTLDYNKTAAILNRIVKDDRTISKIASKIKKLK